MNAPDPLAAPNASDAILTRLMQLHSSRIVYDLARAGALLEKLGHPELNLPPVFHVAGTNGKGSVVAFLRAMLEADGNRVHAYTSPHLVRFHERIRLASGPGVSAPIGEAQLVALLEEVERANGGAEVTFFEITTMMALLAFAREPADAVLLEVGMGGRFDITNVVPAPELTAITPIGLDHQAFLGDTIEEIAAEKAGILKKGVPAVVGPQSDAALEVIRARAEAVGAPLFVHGEDWTVAKEPSGWSYQDTGGLLDLPEPRLKGPYQRENAGTAIAMLRQSRNLTVSDEAIARGLGTVEWAARLQRLSRGPLVDRLPAGAELWLDGGHNAAGAAALAEAMREMAAERPAPLVLVTGMLQAKVGPDYFAPFWGLAEKVAAVPIPESRFQHEPDRASPAEVAAAAEAAGLSATPFPSVEAAMAAVAAAPARVLICGSLYLAGEILAANE